MAQLIKRILKMDEEITMDNLREISRQITRHANPIKSELLKDVPRFSDELFDAESKMSLFPVDLILLQLISSLEERTRRHSTICFLP